jgi:hypothetical protein
MAKQGSRTLAYVRAILADNNGSLPTFWFNSSL